MLNKKLIETGYLLGSNFSTGLGKYNDVYPIETNGFSTDPESILNNENRFWTDYMIKKPILFSDKEEILKIKNQVDEFHKINNPVKYKDYTFKKVACYLVSKIEIEPAMLYKSRKLKDRIKGKVFVITVPKRNLLVVNTDDIFINYGKEIKSINNIKTFTTVKEARNYINNLLINISYLKYRDFKIVKLLKVKYERYALVFTD